MSANARGLTVLTNLRTANDDLPDVAPGATCTRGIVLQKLVKLHQILVRDMALERLEVGEFKDVPFEMDGIEEHPRAYRLKAFDRDDIRKQLSDTSAIAAGGNTILIAPTLRIRVVLRNDGAIATKPRFALVVEEWGL